MILALTWIPFVAALVLLFIPKENEGLLKKLAVLASLLPFLLTLWFFFTYDTHHGGVQFEVILNWLPSLGITYHAGLDGINLTLCLLHALVSLAGVFLAIQEKKNLKQYLFYYLILVGAIYGVFSCLDLFFLYLFYETTLIPLYPMIGIWGSKNKEYGAMQLTLFITAGAVLALFGILLLYKATGLGTFDLVQITSALHTHGLSENLQINIAALVLIGFGVIASLWPLHSWSPIGYAAAPTSVSMLHAGVLKKMGPYLILRIAVAMLPVGLLHWSWLLALCSGIGIIYAGYAAISQKDLKFMVGFSSVSHMGYILLAIASMTYVSLSGAVLLMFSHGVMAAATFACIGFLYEQTHVRGVLDYGGLGKKAPFIAVCFIMACFASVGLPGFSNFASELMVFIGSWPKYPILVGLAIFGVFITSIYLLRAVQNVCYGAVNPQLSHLHDAASWSQRFPFILLLGALLVFGFWPQGLLRLIQPTVAVMLHS